MESSVFQFLSIILVLILCLHWLWTRKVLSNCKMSFPILKGFPIIGSLYKVRSVNYLLQGFGNIFKECKQYTVCLWMGLYPFILTADPDIISAVLNSPELINKAETIYHPLHNLFKGGIIANKAPEWVHNRKMINPSFTNTVLVSLFPIFNKARTDLIGQCSALVDNKSHKILNMLQAVNLYVTMETTMGSLAQKNDQESSDLANKISFVLELTTNQILLSFLKLGWLINFNSKFRNTQNYLREFANNLVLDKINKSNKTKNDKNTITKEIVPNSKDLDAVPAIRKEPKIFIDQAIKLYENQQFTWNDIISETYTIMSASYETTATGVFSTLVMLAMHPDVQLRLFEEVLDVFPEKDFYVECDHLTQLPYLDRVINETLRITPSVAVIGRHVINDTQIGNNIFPKNLQILISIYHLHRRTDIWGPNADKFDPEHFSAENFREIQKNAYMPFSKGVRNCIGWRYALFGMKILLCGLIRNYRFETDFKFEDMRCTTNISLKYIVEPELKLYRRT